MRFCLCLLPFALFAATNDQPIPFSVDLRNPTYKNGILYTTEGGVVRGQDLRIQARTLQYIRKDGVHRIEAEGDILVQYKGKAYVGSELEYDFDSKRGVVYDGKTFSSLWYIGGSKITIHADGSYKVEDASITTCENVNSSWDLHASSVDILSNDLLEAKHVRFRLFHIPTFWLPSFKLNLKKFKEPVFRYSIDWDKGMGPRAMARYQLYSWQDFAMYGRVEYRWKTGWGGAFETEYFPTAYKTTFVTRSYLGTDRLETATNKQRRYRLQGAFHSTSESEQTTGSVTWDKYSDVRMPSDFKSDDFEVNPAKITRAAVRHQASNFIGAAEARPRVNGFESIKQDLPSLFFAPKPMTLGRSGILSSSWLKASYVDFKYSDQLAMNLESFASGRFEARQSFSRTFRLGAATLTPFIGALGIAYTNSPSSQAKWLGIASYGARVQAKAIRVWERYKHIVEPYFEYRGASAPSVAPDAHYIFSIQDGVNRINQFQAGIRNLLFSQKRPGQAPSFSADLFANAFTADPTIPRLIPKLYLDLAWRLPSLHVTWRNAWNFWHQTLDYSNARVQWTLNENAAFSVEGRFRSRFDWRKADHDNFILDCTRQESELLLSPLSDRRITLLLNLFVRFNPFWECQVQSHHGFYRLNETPYNEVKVDLFTWISSAIKLRLSYSHTDRDDRVTAGISLVKK